jgi:sugar diacid utilization regulator
MSDLGFAHRLSSVQEVPAPDDPAPIAHDELAELIRRLVATAEAAGIRVRTEWDDDAVGRSTEQSALIQLVGGSATLADEQAIGFPVKDSRLLVVRASGSASTHRQLAAIRNEPSLVAANLGAARIVALIRNAPRRAGDDRSLFKARQIATLACRFDPSTGVGITTRLTDARQLPAALADADHAAVIAARDGRGVVCVDEMWAHITLERLESRLSECLTVNNPLHALVARDGETGSEFIHTLVTWLSANQDTRRTADELGVHPNTLRYRLKRASELAGLDLDDARPRFVAQLFAGTRLVAGARFRDAQAQN